MDEKQIAKEFLANFCAKPLNLCFKLGSRVLLDYDFAQAMKSVLILNDQGEIISNNGEIDKIESLNSGQVLKNNQALFLYGRNNTNRDKINKVAEKLFLEPVPGKFLPAITKQKPPCPLVFFESLKPRSGVVRLFSPISMRDKYQVRLEQALEYWHDDWFAFLAPDWLKEVLENSKAFFV